MNDKLNNEYQHDKVYMVFKFLFKKKKNDNYNY